MTFLARTAHIALLCSVTACTSVVSHEDPYPLDGLTLRVDSPVADTLVGAELTLEVSWEETTSGPVHLEVRRSNADGELVASLETRDSPAVLPISGLGFGQHTLHIFGTLESGGAGAITLPIAVDDEPPRALIFPSTGVTRGAVRVEPIDGEVAGNSGIDLEATLSSITLVNVSTGENVGFTLQPEAHAVWIVFDDPDEDIHRLTVQPQDLVGNVGPRYAAVLRVDTTPPNVLLPISPPDGATEVSVNPIITLTISESIDASTLTPNSVILYGPTQAIPVQVSYIAPSSQIQITPLLELAGGELHTLVVSTDVLDLAGHPLAAPYISTFLTAQPPPTSFRDVTTATGLADYRGDTGETGERHGPGGVFADLTGDNYPDLLLVTGSGLPASAFINVEGPQAARVFQEQIFDPTALEGSTGAVAADYDNDGDLDVYITNFGTPNRLYQNQLAETGSFALLDVTASTDPTPGIDDDNLGLGEGQYDGMPLIHTLTAAWSDVDRDGWVDLYVGQHNGWAGHAEIGPLPGARDILYRNNGDGTFSDVTMTYGTTGYETSTGAFGTAGQNFSSTNAVIFADLNGDLWPDLFVTNKILGPDDRDMLYINNGTDGMGTWLGYTNVTYELPTEFGKKDPLAMGVAAGDYDNDGDLDLYVTDYSGTPGPNELMVNTWANSSTLDFTSDTCCVAGFSWGAQWEDFDHNGFLDLHVSTNIGLQDFLYLNDGTSFVEDATGYGVAQRLNARGTMIADYNRDGWPDLVVINVSGTPSKLYENTMAANGLSDGHFLAFHLVGDPQLPGVLRSTRDALGARVEVTADIDGDASTDVLIREVVSGTSNAASTSSLELRFGLGAATTADVLIRWPSGRTSSMTSVPVNQRLVVQEGP